MSNSSRKWKLWLTKTLRITSIVFFIVYAFFGLMSLFDIIEWSKYRKILGVLFTISMVTTIVEKRLKEK